MVLSYTSPASAADVEARDYQISVDGKRGGESHFRIARRDDGSTVVTCQADVSVRYALGLYTYRYTYRGTEVWKDSRLVRLTSTANDDGKQYAVRAERDGNGIRVTVNGEEATARADVWTTSYWQLPPTPFRNNNVPLLDADTAKRMAGRLDYVGTSRVRVGGQVVDCAHYRLTGDVRAELYYDGQERLVRQETQEQGHPTVIELLRIRR
jgi:hypothetical protein